MLHNWQKDRSGQDQRRFHEASVYMRDRFADLKADVLAESRERWPVVDQTMLVKPGWILDEPAPLESIRVRLLDSVPAEAQLAAPRRRARRLMPRRRGGSRYSGYSDALVELSGMAHLFNGAVYRPVKIDSVGDRLEIDVTAGRYFDHLDTSMVLSHEAALMSVGRRPILSGPYRRSLRDPFDLTRRAAGMGINTLTVRKGPEIAGFYMHRRNGQWVVEGTEAIHTVPAGEFAPSGPQDDLSIWHTIMREYAEEFLDMAEDAYTPDYLEYPPFTELDEARRSGGLSVHVLGVGLDPLMWKPGLLTVCVFEADVFDAIFAETVVRGKEGTILAGPRGTGIPFTEDLVRQYAEHPNIYGAGGMLLRLAWQHRVALGIE